jgi:hypothetical protein
MILITSIHIKCLYVCSLICFVWIPDLFILFMFFSYILVLSMISMSDIVCVDIVCVWYCLCLILFVLILFAWYCLCRLTVTWQVPLVEQEQLLSHRTWVHLHFSSVFTPLVSSHFLLILITQVWTQKWL